VRLSDGAEGGKAGWESFGAGALWRRIQAMQVLTRTFADFVLREARYEPGYSGSEHRHDLPYFGCVIEGSFLERSRRGRSAYGAGSVHGHPAFDLHAGVVGREGAVCFSILPSDRLAARLESAGLAGGATPRVAMLAARLRQAFRCDDFASTLACEGALEELAAVALGTPLASTRGKPRWLDDARAYLHAHEDGPVTLAALAQVAGVHPVHVARAFRRRLGVTPGRIPEAPALRARLPRADRDRRAAGRARAGPRLREPVPPDARLSARASTPRPPRTEGPARFIR
jgi:AraC family transcriptional regulator